MIKLMQHKQGLDEVYDELIRAKAKAVKIEYYSLYVQSTYPLKQDDYVGGYEAYKQAVDAGKALLSSDTLNAETAKGAYEKQLKLLNQT